MYSKHQLYNIFAPNKKVKEKFFRFLESCEDILDEISANNIKYVLILPYSVKLDYNADDSRYEYSVTYAIINNTEPIKNRNIHKSPYVIYKKNTDNDFVEEVRKMLDLKGKQKGVVLVFDYPLHEQLNRELKHEVQNGTISIKSIYTVALYYHIVNTIKKDVQVDKASLANVCVDVSSGSKAFGRRDNNDNINLIMCNTTSAALAGIQKKDAIATIHLEPELVEAINIATGTPINSPNIILTNAEHIMEVLRLPTSKGFSNKLESQKDKHYSSSVQEKDKVLISDKVDSYVRMMQKIAEIFFLNVPNELKDFLNLFEIDISNFIVALYKHFNGEPVDNIFINEMLNNSKLRSMLYKPDILLVKAVELLVNKIVPYASLYFNPPTDLCHGGDAIIFSMLGLPESANYERQIIVNLGFITYIFYALAYYGAIKELKPRDVWDDYVKRLEKIIDALKGKSTQAPDPQSNTPTSSSQGTSNPSDPNKGSSQQTTRVHILKNNQFIDCHLYDHKSAENYCKILLNGDPDTDKYINSDPLKTIFDIMDYLSSYSGGIFSNIDQIYKINEISIPDIPINFNKYDIENLMLLTCDQNKEAMPLLYRQARIDAELVSNNLASDIINNQFKPKGKNYNFNIIIFKRKELRIDEKIIEALDNLVKDFGKMLQKKVEAMAVITNTADKSKTLAKYNFTGNLILIDDGEQEDLEKTLRQYSQDGFNLVYVIDDHQYLHEMHIPYDEIQKYIEEVSYNDVKIPMTSYLHYILEYTLQYRGNSKNQQKPSYTDITKYRVLINEISLKTDYVRLLCYIYLLFDVSHLDYVVNNKTIKVNWLDILTHISQQAQAVRTIHFSNKPYTVSLEPIKQFITSVQDKAWYKAGFHRCNPNRKKIFEEYRKESVSYYEKFISSKQYNEHSHKIIGACQTPGQNIMNDSVGRVYVSILKPYEFIELRKRPSSGGLYFDQLNQYINTIANRIEGLYIAFSDKLKNHETPEIDYNIEADVMSDALNIKGKVTNKDKLKLLDELDLDYIERIAYIMATYMILLMRSAYQTIYTNWVSILAPIFAQKDVPRLLVEHLPDFDEASYRKAFEFSKIFQLTSTEFIFLILTNRYLNYLYANKDKDVGQVLRELIRDLVTTAASEASVYRIQTLLAGIRMFLQNFICDLYSNSGGRDFMDANKFSGNYLIICEDSDLAAALASSLSILLRFKGKKDKALKEIETLARQFYSNMFKMLYNRNNKWYKKIIHSIAGNKKNEYYNEELKIVDQTLDMITRAVDMAKLFIRNSEQFDKDYPLYGLAALAFVLAIPMTLSLAMSLGERDSTASMMGLVYKYQDTMSAYGITLSNSYCSAGYGMAEMDWPEDHKLSQLIDFPVSTNIVTPENIFDRDNYNEAIITISEVLSHRAKNMQQNLGQIIVTDDYTRLAIDMNNINTIIILSGRRSTFLQGQVQNARILSEKVAWELYDQTSRRANVYYVAFEYDDRIQHIINDSYLKENLNYSLTYARLGLNQGINNLYAVMSQVQSIQNATSGISQPQQATQAPTFSPIVPTIAII